MIDFEKSEYGCFCPFKIVANDERNRKRSVNYSQPLETLEIDPNQIEYLYLTVQK